MLSTTSGFAFVGELAAGGGVTGRKEKGENDRADLPSDDEGLCELRGARKGEGVKTKGVVGLLDVSLAGELDTGLVKVNVLDAAAGESDRAFSCACRLGAAAGVAGLRFVACAAGGGSAMAQRQLQRPLNQAGIATR